MSIVKSEVPTGSESDCFIYRVIQKEDATNTPASTVTASTATVTASAAPALGYPSTPSRRSRLHQPYIDAQVGSPSRAQASSPSSRATPLVPRSETSRKRERSRSPAGSPPSTSKRNWRASQSTTASSGSPTSNHFHDARSNQGDGDEGERNEDRFVLSPAAASPPAGSAASSRTTNFLSAPVPFPLNSSFISTPRNRSLSSSSSSPSPFPGPSRDVSMVGINPSGVKTEVEDSGGSFDSTIPSSSSSSSQASRSKLRIVTNKDWGFSVDLQGSFTNVFDHWTVGIPAVLPSRGPKCNSCKNHARLGVTGQNNKRGNAGRPFYKCKPCNKWITWGDLEGCDPGNDNCRCRKTSRTGVCGPKARCPGKMFWECASGNCAFKDWEPEFLWEVRMNRQEEDEGSEELFGGEGPEDGYDDYYPEDSH